MIDFGKKRDDFLGEAKRHCMRAETFAALNVGAVVVTALLAAVAAITSVTSVPTWITTASAGLSAALGILTASFKPQDKSALHTALAADMKRLASRYDQLADLAGGLPSGTWLDELEGIENLLNKNTPVPDEKKWAAARLPAATPV